MDVRNPVQTPKRSPCLQTLLLPHASKALRLPARYWQEQADPLRLGRGLGRYGSPHVECRDPDRRETFVYEYRLMYRVEPDVARILRVVHGRRLLENVPGSFEEPTQEAHSAA